jgi:RNA-directed DNA polymerase
MKRHGGLFGQVIRFDNLLLAAARKAARGKQDNPSVARFEFHLEQELLALQEEPATGAYAPPRFGTGWRTMRCATSWSHTSSAA